MMHSLLGLRPLSLSFILSFLMATASFAMEPADDLNAEGNDSSAAAAAHPQVRKSKFDFADFCHTALSQLPEHVTPSDKILATQWMSCADHMLSNKGDFIQFHTLVERLQRLDDEKSEGLEQLETNLANASAEQKKAIDAWQKDRSIIGMIGYNQITNLAKENATQAFAAAQKKYDEFKLKINKEIYSAQENLANILKKKDPIITFLAKKDTYLNQEVSFGSRLRTLTLDF